MKLVLKNQQVREYQKMKDHLTCTGRKNYS